MKALVLAGGSGVRLRPFTYSGPKQLIPIANKPVLEYVLEDLRDLGITEICLVVGDWAEAIAAAIGDGARFGVTVTYVHQDRPAGLAHAVLAARAFLGDDDFVMYLGDSVVADGVAGLVEQFRTRRPAAGIIVRKVADPRAYGVAELDVDGAVLRLVEKPRVPRSDLAVIGVYFFTAVVHRAVAAIRPSPRGELEITDAVQWLLSHGHDVIAREYGGFWQDVGRPDDVLACNRRLLGNLTPTVDGHVDSDSELCGQVRVERGARIVRSRIDGPVIVGAGTVIEDSRIGPGTSIGRDCVVRSTLLSDSVVFDGAQICAPQGLHASIVGGYAAVGTGTRTGHRVLVGDHAGVEIAAV